MTTSGFTSTSEPRVDASGIVQGNTLLTTEDGKATLNIAKDTKLFDSEGKALGTLTAALPEEVAEEDLVIAYHDEVAGEWVELDFMVDTVNNIITASVPHFTAFAIISTVTPPEKEEVAAPPEEEEVVSPEEGEVVPPEDEEIVPAKVLAWWLWLIVAIAVVVVVILLIYFLVVTWYYTQPKLH